MVRRADSLLGRGALLQAWLSTVRMSSRNLLTPSTSAS